MSKKLYLLVVVLMVMPMILTACGDDDKKEDKTENKAVNLSQTFTSTTYSLTVKYPEGWIAADGDSGVNVANSQAGLDAMTASSDTEIPAGSFGLQIAVIPLAETGMADQSVVDMLKGMSASMNSDTTKAGDPTELKVGGKDGARVSITDDKQKADGFLIGFKIDDTYLVMVAGVAAKGELDKYEDTALKIAETIAAVPAS